MGFETDGFAYYRRAIPTGLVNHLERSVIECFTAQARKLRALREKLTGDATVDDLDVAVSLLEDHDREAGYNVLPLIAQSAGARRLAAWKGFDELLDGLTLVSAPSVFVNLPGSQRLLYRWHREAHYYPKRRRFVNVWLPLFRPKHRDNGAMAVAVGSHLLGDLPFVEYSGYDDSDVDKANHFRQYEIPESLIEGCERHHVTAEPGDMVVFDRNAVHTSTPNLSGEITYAAVLRVWDPTGDYTLSGNIGATPYGGDYGRPGLQP